MDRWMSHPTWVRGLKQSSFTLTVMNLRVAPYVGAWIETHIFTHSYEWQNVAPYVGAWIETELPLIYIK